MCGIVGYAGPRKAAPVLLEGLGKLEYRGYDSAGIAVRDGSHDPEVIKVKGRLSGLIEKTDGGESVKGCCGIGHTRWATHGDPSLVNAHPHVSGNCSGSGSGAVESDVKKKVYAKQTMEAKVAGISNCPICAACDNNNRTKIWDLKDMDADHVTAWSRGGATDISNCQMLCKTHNRAKGNR